MKRFDDALEELEAIIRAERARTDTRAKNMDALLERLLSPR